MKKLLLFLFIILVSAPAVSADDLNYQCIGKGVADYMNAVIAGAGNVRNVKLLSPAFNMTSSTFDGIVNAIGAAGGNFNSLNGIAGNAYNVDNRRVTSWLTEKLKNTYVSGKPFYLTETGEKDFADGKIGIDEAIARLKPELDALRTFGNPWNAQAALLFNGLGTNSNFPTFQWSVDNLKVLCGSSNCGTVGINQASFFSQSDTIYSIMRDLNMLFDLEIATSGSVEPVIRAVNALPDGNVIVRVGVGDDSGGFSDPQKYVDFIRQVADRANGKTVYFIAGPNEPDSEFWADPQCKTSSLPAKKGPLEEGFNPQNPSLGCDKTKDPEYNPLRPYPGNPCDPLIPRSLPEAPLTSEKKFNTFACGTSLTPQREEVFDPYGSNGYYEGLPGPEGYAHTVCDPVPDNVKKNGGLVTCWRSSAFDVTVDLSHANLGVLSNTQDTTLTDAQKVNEYLSWYLTGTPQIGDQLPIDPNNPADISRVVNYSGPLRKLMPYDLTNLMKNTLAKSNAANQPPFSNEGQVHNYLVGCGQARSITEVTNDIFSALSTAAGAVSNLYAIAADIAKLGFTNFSIAVSSLYAGIDFQHQTFDPQASINSFKSQVTDPAQINAFISLVTDIAANAFDAVVKVISAIEQLNSLEFANVINCDTTTNSADQRRLQDYAGLAPSWIYNLNWYTRSVNDEIMQKLFQNIPFSSLEDTAGEYTMSVFRDPSHDQQIEGLGDQKYSTVVNKNTAPLQLLIKSANLAQ